MKGKLRLAGVSAEEGPALIHEFVPLFDIQEQPFGRDLQNGLHANTKVVVSNETEGLQVMFLDIIDPSPGGRAGNSGPPTPS